MGKPLIPDGLISRAVREGLVKRKALIDAGRTEAEADLLVGQDLKRAWEVSSKQPSTADDTGKYLCGKCFDSGWIVTKPTYWTQIKLKRLYGENPQHQDYMTKCDPCAWIDSERRKRQEQTGEPEGLAAAGMTKRSTSKFSRF